MRILVAAPSATMCAVLSNAMRRLPESEVTACHSLAEAMAVPEPAFELMVVDRDLGSGPDWTWLAGLRERSVPAGRLIVIGTRVSRDEALALRDLGTGAFLLAPVDPSRLSERAQALLALPLVEETPEASETSETTETVEPDEEPRAEAA